MTNNKFEDPVFINLSSETLAIRRNLLSLSFAVLVLKFSEAEIKPPYMFLGMTFEKITAKTIDIILLIILLYLFLHFVSKIDKHIKWFKIRLTGNYAIAKESNKITPKDEWIYKYSEYRDIENTDIKDYDYENSNLISWWRNNFHNKLKPSLDKLINLMDYLRQQQSINSEDCQKLKDAILTFDRDYYYIHHNDRITHSLERFEKGWKNFSLSQNLEFWILTFGAPFASGIFAIIKITYDIFCEF